MQHECKGPVNMAAEKDATSQQLLANESFQESEALIQTPNTQIAGLLLYPRPQKRLPPISRNSQIWTLFRRQLSSPARNNPAVGDVSHGKTNKCKTSRGTRPKRRNLWGKSHGSPTSPLYTTRPPQGSPLNALM